MLLADGTLGLVMLVLWVFCVADCIISDEARVRSLPKLLWLLIVLVLPDVGSLLWLALGRPKGTARSMPYKGNAGVPTKYDRPGRAIATNPDDDAAFLRQLRDRAEQQRRGADQQRRSAEQERRSAEQQRRTADPDAPPLS